MAMRQVIACHWCDLDAVSWIDWTIHEIPGAYGGGGLVAYIPLCPDHYEFITVTLEVRELPQVS
jgi:hypothetical protein